MKPYLVNMVLLYPRSHCRLCYSCLCDGCGLEGFQCKKDQDAAGQIAKVQGVDLIVEVYLCRKCRHQAGIVEPILERLIKRSRNMQNMHGVR
jgi:hypothetical protein